jgi:hypothetical protein
VCRRESPATLTLNSQVPVLTPRVVRL